MSKKRPVVRERSKTGVVCGGSQKVVDLRAPKGLGYGGPVVEVPISQKTRSTGGASLETGGDEFRLYVGASSHDSIRG